jgi:opacity protein-like surface antigen
MKKIAILASVALALTSTAAAAQQIFISKGDVQEALGWNNKQLQDGQARVGVRTSSSTESSWVCSRLNPQGTEQTQERANTTTVSEYRGTAVRERNQVTGFYLDQVLSGGGTTVDGPAIGSCPNGWTAGTVTETALPGSTREIYEIL